jgi:hypothetical protein
MPKEDDDTPVLALPIVRARKKEPTVTDDLTRAGDRIRERLKEQEAAADSSAPTEQSVLAAAEAAIKRIEHRTHPLRILVGALAAIVVVVGTIVALYEGLATREYVDKTVAPFQRDHDVLMEVLGWQRAIGTALGVPRPAPIVLPQPRNPDGGTP